MPTNQKKILSICLTFAIENLILKARLLPFTLDSLNNDTIASHSYQTNSLEPFSLLRRQTVANSVLEAIKDGIWDFEPENTKEEQYTSTPALPGSDNKLEVLAERLEQGLPLWHPADRQTYDDGDHD
jgi:hypothetical protein